MGVFFHSPDDNITIDDGAQSVTMSLATFKILEPAYALPVTPANVIWQRYEQGVNHELHTSTHAQSDGAYPWTDGDRYISNVSTYLDQYNNPTEDLATAKDMGVTELINVYNTKLGSGITLFSTTMPSHASITDDVISYNSAGDVPGSYYLKDMSGTEQTITLTQLNQYHDAIVEMRWALRQVYDDIYDSIQAAVDIPAVEAIDLNAGWPSLPFVPT